jgi:predicted NUDIX family phosphoesterase
MRPWHLCCEMRNHYITKYRDRVVMYNGRSGEGRQQLHAAESLGIAVNSSPEL